MNLKVEEILMVVIAFLIGWFLSNMISGSSSGSGSRVKAVGGKHRENHGCALKTTYDGDGMPEYNYTCSDPGNNEHYTSQIKCANECQQDQE